MIETELHAKPGAIPRFRSDTVLPIGQQHGRAPSVENDRQLQLSISRRCRLIYTAASSVPRSYKYLISLSAWFLKIYMQHAAACCIMPSVCKVALN